MHIHFSADRQANGKHSEKELSPGRNTLQKNIFSTLVHQSDLEPRHRPNDETALVYFVLWNL